MNIYVSNLGLSMQDDELKRIFTEYGMVSSAKIINDRETGKSRGFGFVQMGNDDAARKAIKELDGKMSDGRPMRVNEARATRSNFSSGRG